MNEENYEEIESVLEMKGIATNQEVIEAFKGLAIVIGGAVAEAFSEFCLLLGVPSETDRLQDSFESHVVEIEKDERFGWSVDWDTRKCSQVISNKPRFIVRKIIG